MYLVARLAQLDVTLAGRCRIARAANLGRRSEALMREQHMPSCVRDDVAHGHAAAVAPIELEAGEESCIGEALEPPLCGRWRPARVEASVQLRAGDVPEAPDERQHFQVQ